VDNAAMQLIRDPSQFDVIVTENLFGDILSDEASIITGSIGMLPSASMGTGQPALFEPIHGSAPDIAGQDLANPSGLLLAAIQLLAHVGQGEVATRLQNAWLRTLEDGIHTADLHRRDSPTDAVGTKAFGQAVADRLGERPAVLMPARLRGAPLLPGEPPARPRPLKVTVGVDVFLHAPNLSAEDLGSALQAVATSPLPLRMITNRGVKVWPDGLPETTCVDHWRCRYQAETPVSGRQILDLLAALVEHGFDVVKTEHLCTFDGQPGFSLGQGQ